MLRSGGRAVPRVGTDVDRHVGRSYRVAASTALGVVLLAVLGAVMGPQWDPVPLADPLVVETSSTAIGSAAPVPEYDVRDVRRLGPARRRDGRGPDQRAGRARRPQAGGRVRARRRHRALRHRLPRAGARAGGLRDRRDGAEQAARHVHHPAPRLRARWRADYDASVALLQSYPGVDPDGVGIYAESEGGWIAPIMAAQDPSIAFVVLVSSPVVPPREQAAFAVDSYLRNTGVPHGVFRAIPRAVGMSLPGGGFEYADFDVTPVPAPDAPAGLRRLRHGRRVDARRSRAREQVIEDTAVAGNGDVTVRYYEGANHGIRVGRRRGRGVPARPVRLGAGPAGDRRRRTAHRRGAAGADVRRGARPGAAVVRRRRRRPRARDRRCRADRARPAGRRCSRAGSRRRRTGCDDGAARR